MPYKKIQIAIVDNQMLVRAGLVALLEKFRGIKVAFEANNGPNLLEKLKKHPLVSVILMDIDMPLMDGFVSTKWLKTNYPEMNILALSASDDEGAIISILKADAGGYLLKESKNIDLFTAIQSIQEKGFYINDLVSGRLLASLKKDSGKPTFSEKELMFLKLCCSELTYKEIAQQMGVSHRTVDNYRESLFVKFNIKSRSGLIVSGIRNGLVRI